MVIRFRMAAMPVLAALFIASTAFAAPSKTIERNTTGKLAVQGLRSIFPADSKKTASDRSSIVRTALSFRGTRYRYGGTGRSGFDCSGFIRYVYGKDGTGLPRTAAEQYRIGKKVSLSQLKPGDLLFYRTSRKRVGHVAMYMGNGKMIHAANPRKGVTVDSINSPYYKARFVGARRPGK